MYLIIIFVVYIISLSGYHLSPVKHKIINKLIRSNNISTSTRNKLNKLLYLGYEKWALKNAYNFKKRHVYKCLRIPTQELIQYARCGLYKSILNYNGNSNFTNYAEIYVNSELKKALTDSYSLSILPKSIRIATKKNLTEIEKEQYKNLLTVETRSNVVYLYNNKQETPVDVYDKYKKYGEIWNKINELDPFIKRCMYLKYDYDFKEIRSSKQVAELMCCSEETIRTQLIKIQFKIN